MYFVELLVVLALPITALALAILGYYKNAKKTVDYQGMTLVVPDDVIATYKIRVMATLIASLVTGFVGVVSIHFVTTWWALLLVLMVELFLIDVVYRLSGFSITTRVLKRLEKEGNDNV